MYTTPASLLERIRQPASQQAWARLVDLYSPLLYYWTRRLGLQAEDCADLVQEVFVVLVQKLPEFNYDRQKSFRNWLRTLTLNKWRDWRRRRALPRAQGSEAILADLPDEHTHEEFWETEYRQHLVIEALRLMQEEFQPATWKACWEHVVSGRSAAEVARELGISEGAVYVCKSRVLRRLRQELAGMLD
jgi:RNA polymerase sigma-70 factor (ECF subfamily)